MRSKNITLSLLVILCSFSVQAKTFKCIDSKGNASYSHSYCKEDQKEDNADSSKEIVDREATVSKGASATKELRLISGLPLGPHTPDSRSVGTGFIDSGINSEHPQIKGLVIAQKDFTGEGLETNKNHGTEMALVFLKSSFDLAKLDAKGSSKNINLPPLVSAKVIGSSAATSQEIADRMVKAIQWLSEIKVTTVTIGLTLPKGAADYTALCKAIKGHEKILFIISAADKEQDPIVYPAACVASNTLIAGAITQDGVEVQWYENVR